MFDHVPNRLLQGYSKFLKNNGLSILKNTAKTLINQREASKNRLSL